MRWSDEEIARFCQTAKQLGCPSLAFAVELCGVTGQRRGDLIALTRDTYLNGVLRLVQRKGGARIAPPLAPQLRRRLEALPRHQSGYLIVDEELDSHFTTDRLSKRVKQVREAAGLPTLTLHDHRRTAAWRMPGRRYPRSSRSPATA